MDDLVWVPCSITNNIRRFCILFDILKGFTAKDEFYVTYRDEALNSSMVEVVVNTLRYFLDRPDIEAEDSY